MTDFTWFRLVLRAIGVLLLGLALPKLIEAIAYIGDSVWTNRGLPSFGETSFSYVLWMVGPLSQLVLALYLIAGGRRLAGYCVRSVLRYCVGCNYDLLGVPGAVCPECGTPIPVRTREATNDLAARPPGTARE